MTSTWLWLSLAIFTAWHPSPASSDRSDLWSGQEALHHDKVGGDWRSLHAHEAMRPYPPPPGDMPAPRSLPRIAASCSAGPTLYRLWRPTLSHLQGWYSSDTSLLKDSLHGASRQLHDRSHVPLAPLHYAAAWLVDNKPQNRTNIGGSRRKR